MINKSLKKLLFLLVLFLHVLVILSFKLYSQEAKRQIVIKKENAILRLYPREDSLAIKELPLGAFLEVEEKIGEWFKIVLPLDKDGIVITGYVHQRFIEEPTKEPPKVTEITEKKKPSITPIPHSEEPIPAEKERFSKFYLGGGAGYSITANEEYQGGVYFRGFLGFCITKNIALQIGGTHTQINTVSSQDGLSNGKLSIIPVLLSLKFRFPIKQLFIPYIGIGGGYSFNKFSILNETVSAWNQLGFNITEHVDNTVAFSIDAGLDYLITKNVALNIELNYSNVKIEGSWIIKDQISDIEKSGAFKSSSLNTVFVGGGLKIIF